MDKNRAPSPLAILFTLLLCGLIWVATAGAAPSFNGRLEPRADMVGQLLPHRPLGANAAGAPIFHTPPTALHIILLRVDFPADASAATSGSGEWSDPLYAYAGDSDYWVNKNRDELIAYFSEVSRGKLTLSIDISPDVYRLPNPMAYYGDETNADIENLIVDSVKTAEGAPYNLDLSPYDTIVIVHAGMGEETSYPTSDIWSLYYDDSKISTNDSAANPALTLENGTPVLGAILMPQTEAGSGPNTVDPFGVYAHEFGHLIGLPDLYPTDTQSWAGPGEWCLMAAGSYNRVGTDPYGSSPAWPSAWCRYYLGWEDAPLEQTSSDPDLGELTFQAATAAVAPGEVRLVKVPVTAGSTTNFFLIENRQQAGFDAGLYGHGLLIWKIDDYVINSRIALNTINNTPTRPGVALLEADGDGDLMSWDGYADTGDTLPGSLSLTVMTPTTTPVSTTTSTGPGWLNLKSISEAAGKVTCTVALGPDAVDIISATLRKGTVEIEWSDAAGSVTYHVYRNGTLVATAPDTYFTEDGVLTTDKYTVASVDADGNETLRKVTVTTTTAPSANEGGGGGCFIATAAYGSYEAPAVQTLRLFRDKMLLTNAPGRAFVAIYYHLSPPLADFIATSPLLKAGVRIALIPLIGVAVFCVKLSILQQEMVILLFLSLFVLIWRLTERRRQQMS